MITQIALQAAFMPYGIYLNTDEYLAGLIGRAAARRASGWTISVMISEDYAGHILH